MAVKDIPDIGGHPDGVEKPRQFGAVTSREAIKKKNAKPTAKEIPVS